MLVAQAAYHLDELLPLRDELGRRGIPATVAIPEPPRRPLHRLRPAVRRHRQLLRAIEGRAPVGAPTAASGLLAGAGAFVVMNDWGAATSSLVSAARAGGIPTIGWVEGVQDFADIDTGRSRRAYRTVDHVMTLGSYDAGQLAGVPTTVVGSGRLRRLWDAEPAAGDDVVAVNCNFTYRVLEEHRRAWLRSVRSAGADAGVALQVSQHAADRALLDPRTRTSEPVGALLQRASVFVSRFSTVCYEALVRGVPLAYHNPHGEQVPTFRDPQGAFDLTAGVADLGEVLRRERPDGRAVRAAAGAFLEHHLRLDGPPPELVAGDVVADLRVEA
ncbi:MAG: hypothetical protein AAGD18_14630 [Actinomycetota bacterium]